MSEKSVLLVGFPLHAADTIRLPEAVNRSQVDSIGEAVDLISLTPPDLIVANDQIGELDSLDFFREVMKADPDHDTPVVFVASPESGVQPFLYETRRPGFAVRYLDGEAAVHAYFVRDGADEKSHTVRTLNRDTLEQELAGILEGGEGGESVPSEEDLEARLWEVGFNHNVAVGETDYHVQSEVVEIKPLTVATTVFAGGRTVHFQEQKVKTKPADLALIRAEVEGIHVDVLSRLKSGALR